MAVTWAGETRYPFANPNPLTRAFARLGYVMFSGFTVVLLGLLAAGVLSVADVLWMEGFLAPFCIIIALRFGFLAYRLDKGAIITSGSLLVKQWTTQQEYPWRDVASVSLESLSQRGKVARLWGRIYMGGDQSERYVKIRLRRSIRLRVWGGWFGDKLSTRGFGPAIPGFKEVTFYLAEPERFVEDAQQHMLMMPPPVMSI